MNTVCCRDYRDQGLTRPKVLMLLPFRESAKRVVDLFIQLLNPTDQVGEFIIENIFIL